MPVVDAKYELVSDPYDVTELLDRFTFRLEDESARAAAARRRGAGAHGDRRSGQPNECPGRVELFLYVSSHSLFTAIAIENFKRLMAQLYPNRIKVTIHQVTGNAVAASPRPAAERSQGPRTFIIGHVTSPDPLLELLAECARG